MAVVARIYGKAFKSVWNKEIDWEADAIKVALTTATITTTEQDADQYFSAITEITGTGYTAGGDPMQTLTSTYTGGSNTFILDADDTTWSTSTLSAHAAVVYDSTPGSSATNPLICFVDAGADVTTTAGTFTIQWHADGIVKIVLA